MSKRFHNLWKIINPPENIVNLLGLGLEFCIQKINIEDTSVDVELERIKRDLRLRYHFSESDDTESPYN